MWETQAEVEAKKVWEAQREGEVKKAGEAHGEVREAKKVRPPGHAAGSYSAGCRPR